MSKLLTLLVAGVAAMAFNATAADQAKDPQSKDNQTQAQPNAPKGKPGQADANLTSQPGSNSAGSTGGTADNTQHNQTPNQAGQAGADEGNMGRKPNQPGGDVTAQEKDYLAEIEKCNAMSGNQKKQCVSAAKKKAGQM